MHYHSSAMQELIITKKHFIHYIRAENQTRKIGVACCFCSCRRERLYPWTTTSNGPTVHTQMIHDHEEPWWNDMDGGKLLIRPSELSGSLPAESSSGKSRGTWRRKLWTLPSKYLCSHFEVIFCMPLNLTTWDQRLYFPSEGRRAVEFCCP
jgi:hypothetical protein